MKSEKEVIQSIKDELKAAATECDTIGTTWLFADEYERLRKNLTNAEKECNNAGSMREDFRWYVMGMRIEEVHQRARKWLHKPTVEGKKLFTMLAALLRKWVADFDQLATAKTGKVGMILPPGIDKTPQGMYSALSSYTDSVVEKREEKRKSGLIIPDGVQVT